MSNNIAKGFIFINNEGCYAITGLSGGFGPTQQVIHWVKDIHNAEVFPHEAMARRKFKALEKCQSLMAVARREVSIEVWSE